MKKCLHCNEECEDVVTICPKCGAMVDTYINHKEYMDVYHVNHGKRIRNYRLIFWFLLGLILPYVGFFVCWILYDSDREKVKSILLGTIVSTIISSFLPYVLIWLLGNGSSDDGNDKGQKIERLLEIYKGL